MVGEAREVAGRAEERPAREEKEVKGSEEGDVVDKDQLARAIVMVREGLGQKLSPSEAIDRTIKSLKLSEDSVDALQGALSKALQDANAARKRDSMADERKPGEAPGAGADIMAALDERRKQSRSGDPEVYSDSGRDYYAAGDFRRSFDDYRRAIELGASGPKVYVGYGSAALRLGDYALAAKAAQVALDGDPKNKAALFLYHSAQDRAPTVRLPSVFGDSGSQPAAEANSQVSGPAAASGAAAVSSPEAVARSQAALPAAVVERSALLTKEAANALRVRDYPVAYQQASQAISLNAMNAQALNYRAVALTHLNRYQDAVQDASLALTLAPGNAAILQTRSRAYSHQGLYHEGLKDADETLLRDAANAFAYDSKAFALAGLHDNQGAIEALKNAARLDGRFQGRLERALQMPEDGDMTLLFDDKAAAAQAPAAAPSPGSRQRRFLRLAVLSGVGGLLIALGVLHVVSASWRDKVRMTVRRVLAPSDVAVGSDSAASTAPAGAFWTQYDLVKEIGLGGMGVVYEAFDRSLERRVAVKKMRDEIRLDPADRQRFVREARMVAQLHHPNIVDIYAIVEDGPELYLVFEYVEGLTLYDALKSSGPMDLAKARRVLKEMSAAVEHAHEKGVIHRDIKPSNVMLTPDGRVKVMDFGVARQAKDAMAKLSMTNTVVGTPPYMAPEQEQGTVRRESDVYALAVCFYEMLTGNLPFSGGGAAMLLNKLNGKHVPPSHRNSSFPPALDAVIARALSPDPDKRYRTPAELASAVDALA